MHKNIIFVAVIVAIWYSADIFLSLGSGYPESFGSDGFYKGLMNFLSFLRFFLIFFGGAIIYSYLFTRNAPLWLRLFGSWAVSFAYATTAFVHGLNFFSFFEALYYCLNPLFLGPFLFQCALMGLSDICIRWIRRKKAKEPSRVFKLGNVSGIIVGFAGIFVALLWEGGVHLFYVYQAGYRFLFH